MSEKIILCERCQKNAAIVEIKQCSFEDTREYEFFNDEYSLSELSEEEADEIIEKYWDMRKIVKESKKLDNWDELEFTLFQKTIVEPCESCAIEIEEEMRIDVKRRRLANERKFLASIPDRLLKAGVKKIYLDACLDDCKDWVREYKDKSLFLQGAVGSGKTHTAVALLRADIIENKRAFFTTSSDLLLEIQSTFDQKLIDDMEERPKTKSELINYYSNIPNLYLDDIGVEKTSDWVVSTLCHIIDNRYSNNLRTIVTSNLNLAHLAKHFGDRFASRIAGLCGKPKKIDGSDLRMK